MYGRRSRSLSQRNYQLLQQIHAEADRLRQIDRGLVYRPAATRVTPDGHTMPIHVGPELELKATRTSG